MDALQRASLAMTAFSAGTRTVRMAWLRSSLAHSARNTVRSCAGGQLVLPQDDVGVGPHGHVVVGDTDLSVQDLVGGDTAGLDGGVPDLDTVLHPEGEDDGLTADIRPAYKRFVDYGRNKDARTRLLTPRQ